MAAVRRAFRLLLIAAVVLMIAAAAILVTARFALDSDALRDAAEARLSRMLGQPVTIGDFVVSLLPRVSLTGSDIRIGAEERDAPTLDLQRIHVVPRVRSLIEDSIVVEEVQLEGLTLSLLRDSRGRWHLPAAVPATEGEGDRGLVVERVQLRDGRVRVFRESDDGLLEAASLDDLEAELVTEGDELRLSPIAGRVGRAEFTGQARLGPQAAQLELKSEAINDDDLPALLGLAGAERPAFMHLSEPASIALSMRIDRETSRLSGSGSLRAPQVSLEPLRLERFEAPFKMDDRRLTFEPTTFALYGGTHRGAIIIDLSQSPPRWSIDSRMEHLDLGDFLTTLTDAGKRLDGTLTGGADVGGRIGEPLNRTVQGRARLDVNDGVVRQFPLLAALNRALRLAEGDTRDTRFERLAATLMIADGQATTDDLVLEAAEMRVEAGGRIGFDRSLELSGRAVFSSERSAEAIRSINELAALRNARGELELPLTITGTLDNPAFRIDVAAALGKTLKDELQRRIRSLIPPGV